MVRLAWNQKGRHLPINILLALKLCRELGLGTTTLEKIAAEADNAQGTLYSYFAAMEAILDEYIRRNFMQSNAARTEQMRQLDGR